MHKKCKVGQKFMILEDDKMCKIKSAIVLKDRIYMPFEHDHHTQMLEELGMKDDSEFPNFVRVEICPVDGDIYNHNLDNWKLSVDQDYRPDWFDADKADKDCKVKIQEWFDKHFIIDKEVERLESGIYRVKNSKIKVLGGNAKLLEMWGTSSVGEMWGTSSVGKMWGTSSVGEMWNTSSVGKMWGTSSVGEMWNTSSVGKMWGISSVGKMCDTSSVGDMCDTSSVGKMCDTSSVGDMCDTSSVGKMCDTSSVGGMWNTSSVGEMCDTSSVGKMCDTSSVGKMCDTSSVGKMWGTSSVGKMCDTSSVGKMYDTSSITIPHSKNVKIKSMHDNATIKDLSSDKPRIIIADDNDFEIVKHKEANK
jgi:hypothetical protein